MRSRERKQVADMRAVINIIGDPFSADDLPIFGIQTWMQDAQDNSRLASRFVT
jgi:hypothetical protein